MSLLTPLGLLGLLGIVALILVYILKPNYQQKIVSSTYVWKLSLKYRKKRVPINRFRNILIFICQVLILALCAMLLAQPFLQEERLNRGTEKVIILDSSASMLVSNEEGTRFERAIREIRSVTRETVHGGGTVSVILADDDAHFLAQGCADNAALDALELELNEVECSYASADVQGATELAEQVLMTNPDADVLFYTATNYIGSGEQTDAESDKKRIAVVNVATEDEWNVAVLNAYGEMNDDNYYEFKVDAGYYGNSSQEIFVYCDVYNPNGKGENEVLSLSKPIRFSEAEKEQTVVFTPNDFFDAFRVEGVYSYDYLRAYVLEEDSLAEDNTFYYYGGSRPTLRVQYSSPSSRMNNYFSTIILNLRDVLKNSWDIDFKEHGVSDRPKADEFITEGFDFYIFEHVMPDHLPTDGVVLLVNPDKAPDGADFVVDKETVKLPSSDMTLASGTPHPLTQYMDPGRITLLTYQRIVSHDGYEELLYYAGDPVLMVKNTELSKVVVLGLNLNTSNLAIRNDFTYLMYNMFQYFLPTTVSGFDFEIGETVTLKSRAPFLELSGPDIELHYDSFPSEFVVKKPGTYTLTQTSMTGEYIVENFYAHIPNIESNITKEVDPLPELSGNKKEYDDIDLLIYFASALVALLFLEWWLQSREYF